MQTRIETIMRPASDIARGTLIRDALHWIVRLGYRHLPVVDEANRLIGVATRATLAEDTHANIWGADVVPGVPERRLAPLETGFVRAGCIISRKTFWGKDGIADG